MSSLPKIQLYNTLSRTIEELRPITSGEVKLYCCGPTVYNFQHIGNLRTYIWEDILARMLRQAGYKVTHVMNITDVGHLASDADEGEDKMMLAMKREKKKSEEIADYYTKVFFDDCAALNIQKPDIVCKATEHIAQMIALIKRLEERGCAYQAGGNVYFDVRSISDYGKLARLNLDKLQAGARIEQDSNKRNPHDFALWFTKSKFENQELQWDSPWGRGYPGWHIECSAMAMHYLGEQFDIHCGGIDHVPVHHTNEIAQSEGATGKAWVTIWMHGEFLVLGTEKMAKSKGNFITVNTLRENSIDPLAYRYFLLGAHYRTQLSFTLDILRNAQQGFEKLRSAVIQLRAENSPAPMLSAAAEPFKVEFFESIRNDLGTAQALALVHKTLQSELPPSEKLSLLLTFDEVLGLGMAHWKAAQVELTPALQALIDARKAARAAKNWPESDRLRDEIAKLGYIVEDGAGGQKLKKG